MKPRLLALIILLSVASNCAAQQRRARPAKPPDTGPVTVTRAATLQVLVASDAVSVFAYLTDPAKITAWLADQAILEPKFGGKYHYRWNNQDPVDGVVTEYIAANTLALTWKHPTDDVETQVRFKLSFQGGQTLVELEHQGFASAADLDKAVKSWVFYLENLKSVIETQTDLRTQVKPAPRPRPR
jgi:uncharacterized protein YndB with AHSA1/START domain